MSDWQAPEKADWRPIAAARFIPNGTRALLRCEHGSIRHAVWEERTDPDHGWRATAWWMEDGNWTGLYNAFEFLPIAEPMSPLPAPTPQEGE